MSNTVRIDAALAELTRQNAALRDELVGKAADLAELRLMLDAARAEAESLRQETDGNLEAAPPDIDASKIQADQITVETSRP